MKTTRIRYRIKALTPSPQPEYPRLCYSLEFPPAPPLPAHREELRYLLDSAAELLTTNTCGIKPAQRRWMLTCLRSWTSKLESEVAR